MEERPICDAVNRERIARIERMERVLNEAQQTLHELENVSKRYHSMLYEVEELTAYYESTAWREDFEADERGEIPVDVKRGVLSEDGKYSFLHDQQQVIHLLRMLTAKICPGAVEKEGKQPDEGMKIQ